jgi:hypothetical protein
MLNITTETTQSAAGGKQFNFYLRELEGDFHIAALYETELRDPAARLAFNRRVRERLEYLCLPVWEFGFVKVQAALDALISPGETAATSGIGK